MKNIIKLFTVFVLLLGCGFEPILQSKNLNFSINEITKKGEEKLNLKFERKIKEFINLDNSKKIYDLEIKTQINKFASSKDTKGNPKTFNLEINSELIVIKNKEIISVKNFAKNTSYKTKSSKFELKNYEQNLINNLFEKIIDEIIVHINSL